jgi:hypothetical protein
MQVWQREGKGLDGNSSHLFFFPRSKDGGSQGVISSGRIRVKGKLLLNT